MFFDLSTTFFFFISVFISLSAAVFITSATISSIAPLFQVVNTFFQFFPFFFFLNNKELSRNN